MNSCQSSKASNVRILDANGLTRFARAVEVAGCSRRSGRPWNDVYSEACAVIKPDSIIRAHVKTHLLRIRGAAYVHARRKGVHSRHRLSLAGIIPVSGTALRLEFVLRASRVGFALCRIRRNHGRPGAPSDERLARTTFAGSKSNVALKQIRGLWFECQFRSGVRRRTIQSLRPRAWPAGRTRGELTAARRRNICTASLKRQLSRRELRRLWFTQCARQL